MCRVFITNTGWLIKNITWCFKDGNWHNLKAPRSSPPPNFSQSEVTLPIHFQNSVKVRLFYDSETNSEPMQQSVGDATSCYIIELNYNVMEHAQKTIFMYGRNRRAHILLQQVWGVDSSARCWQLVSAMEWLVTGLLNPLSTVLFSLTFPQRRFVPSHSNQAPPHLFNLFSQQYQYDSCWYFLPGAEKWTQVIMQELRIF
jgi:hypothetical protein